MSAYCVIICYCFTRSGRTITWDMLGKGRVYGRRRRTAIIQILLTCATLLGGSVDRQEVIIIICCCFCPAKVGSTDERPRGRIK